MLKTKPFYLQITPKWFAVALTVFTLTFIGGLMGAWVVFPKVYTATAALQIDNPTPNEIGAMESPDLLVPIIENYNLTQYWSAQTASQAPLSSEEALALLKKSLKIVRKPGTNIFEITATSERPEEAALVANVMAGSYKAAKDMEEARREHQGETDELQKQIDQQQTGIREKLPERESLKQDLAKKGIPIPSDDTVLAQLAARPVPNEDPQLSKFKRDEYELMIRQSILNTLVTRLRMMSFAGSSKKSPVEITTTAEIPQHPSRSNMILGMLLVGAVGIILGVVVAMLTIGRRRKED